MVDTEPGHAALALILDRRMNGVGRKEKHFLGCELCAWTSYGVCSLFIYFYFYFLTYATWPQQKAREKKCGGPPKICAAWRAGSTARLVGADDYCRTARVKLVRKPMFKACRFVFDNRYRSR